MKTILIVDDEKSSRRLLVEILKPAGYLLLEAEEGKEALAILDKKTVDLVITDRSMPGMDGVALLKALGLRKFSAPIIMISAYGEEKSWGEALGLGAKEYLLKPYKTNDVLKAVRHFLAGGDPKK